MYRNNTREHFILKWSTVGDLQESVSGCVEVFQRAKLLQATRQPEPIHQDSCFCLKVNRKRRGIEQIRQSSLQRRSTTTVSLCTLSFLSLLEILSKPFLSTLDPYSFETSPSQKLLSKACRPGSCPGCCCKGPLQAYKIHMFQGGS